MIYVFSAALCLHGPKRNQANDTKLNNMFLRLTSSQTVLLFVEQSGINVPQSLIYNMVLERA